MPQDKKEKLYKRIREFKRTDFNVTLGSVLEPEWRNYYIANGFKFLEEKLKEMRS